MCQGHLFLPNLKWPHRNSKMINSCYGQGLRIIFLLCVSYLYTASYFILNSFHNNFNESTIGFGRHKPTSSLYSFTFFGAPLARFFFLPNVILTIIVHWKHTETGRNYGKVVQQVITALFLSCFDQSQTVTLINHMITKKKSHWGHVTFVPWLGQLSKLVNTCHSRLG